MSAIDFVIATARRRMEQFTRCTFDREVVQQLLDEIARARRQGEVFGTCIKALEGQVEELEGQVEDLDSTVDELTDENDLLKNENAMLRGLQRREEMTQKLAVQPSLPPEGPVNTVGRIDEMIDGLKARMNRNFDSLDANLKFIESKTEPKPRLSEAGPAGLCDSPDCDCRRQVALKLEAGYDKAQVATMLERGFQFTCPRCNTVSRLPRSIAQGWCDECNDWTTPNAPAWLSTDDGTYLPPFEEGRLAPTPPFAKGLMEGLREAGEWHKGKLALPTVNVPKKNDRG